MLCFSAKSKSKHSRAGATKQPLSRQCTEREILLQNFIVSAQSCTKKAKRNSWLLHEASSAWPELHLSASSFSSQAPGAAFYLAQGPVPSIRIPVRTDIMYNHARPKSFPRLLELACLDAAISSRFSAVSKLWRISLRDQAPCFALFVNPQCTSEHI